MNVSMITLGCKVNQYESQAMLEDLCRKGFSACPAGEKPDIVVINSCTVTATSDHKVRQTVRHTRRTHPDAVIVLTGCMPQAFPEESAALQEADIVLGNTNRHALCDDILQFMRTHERVIDITPHENGETYETMQVGTFFERTRAFVKIEDGCNRFCSYCIIPYSRGRVRSRPMDQLEDELRQLGEHGYREVVLTGINLSAYGQDLGLTLCDAVEAACRVPQIARVRLGSLEPEELSPDVIARMAKQEKLCPQFHLSLQSGCDATLKRMNRHYDTAEYRRIVENLRAAFPGCAITTDIMVGFAGETDEEFEQSLRFAEEIGFAKAHVFMYSRRRGTRADAFPDQVSNAVKEERSRRMIAVTNRTRRAFLQQQVGTVQDVLFEQRAKDGSFEGHTPNYTLVRVSCPGELAGCQRPVRISEAGEDGCTGTFAE